MSGDEELDLFSNPLLAFSPVPSPDLEVDLFVPPPMAPVPQQKVKGEKALPSAPPMPLKKVKEENALPSAPLVAPPTSKRRIGNTIPSETNPLGLGDWLTDKDILCWLNQEL